MTSSTVAQSGGMVPKEIDFETGDLRNVHSVIAAYFKNEDVM